jgi:predicted nuclease of predicted toxin-antitoxin system
VNLAFLADENVEIDIVDRLKSLGHTAAHASEVSPGRPDTAVLQAASLAGQVLITNDKDFGELVFRKHHRSAGVILLRLPGRSPATKARLVADAIQRYGGELLGAFVVIGPRTIRLRRVPD